MIRVWCRVTDSPQECLVTHLKVMECKQSGLLSKTLFVATAGLADDAMHPAIFDGDHRGGRMPVRSSSEAKLKAHLELSLFAGLGDF